MKRTLTILGGVILISLLAACDRLDGSKDKAPDPQAAQNSPPEPTATDDQASAPAPPPATDDQTPAQSEPGAPPSDQVSNPSSYPQTPRYSTAQIDQMVAPIALYPDALMIQVLMASAYPYDVSDADGWLRTNRGLSGRYLDDALATSSWDPSVIALCKFPSALDRMGRDIQWTTDLGYAFLNQRTEVMGAVQRLRQVAYRNGHLKTSSQVRVVVETEYIVIQPYTSSVYYVPYYDPRIVYGAAWNYPHHYYQAVWTPSPGYVFVNGFAWGAGVSFGGVLFGGYDWNHQNVYVNNNVFYGNTIYRNTDYYRNRSRLGGQVQGSWTYNARYNQRDEGFVRAPYAGRSRGEVRGMPENAVRGGARGRGNNQAKGYGQGSGNDPRQNPKWNGHDQGVGQGQGLGKSQNRGAGKDKHQDIGQGQRADKNKKQGAAQGQRADKNKKQGAAQGQRADKTHRQGADQGQRADKNKRQGDQGQRADKDKKQGAGKDQSVSQGQSGGKNKK